MSPEMKMAYTDAVNSYSKKKAEILAEHKIRVKNRQDVYLENCKTMKEYYAWEISYRMDREISEWIHNEISILENNYCLILRTIGC